MFLSLGSITLQSFLCKCAHIRAAHTREHPSDDPFYLSIKLNKSVDQRVSSCSLPRKATVAMAATRLSLRQQREKHTNTTTHSKWRLELFHLSEEEYDLSMVGHRPWHWIVDTSVVVFGVLDIWNINNIKDSKLQLGDWWKSYFWWGCPKLWFAWYDLNVINDNQVLSIQ